MFQRMRVSVLNLCVPATLQTRVLNMQQRGFTLFESIIVIVITGILAGMVSIFIFSPVQSFFSTSARTELVDASDNALRLMSREMRKALPNSVRVRADGLGIEFVPTVAGARYRTEVSTVGDDPLLFSQADTSFDVFGTPVNVVAGNWAVVYNLGAVVGSNVYAASSSASEQSLSNGGWHFRSIVHPWQPGECQRCDRQLVRWSCTGNSCQLHTAVVNEWDHEDPGRAL